MREERRTFWFRLAEVGKTAGVSLRLKRGCVCGHPITLIVLARSDLVRGLFMRIHFCNAHRTALVLALLTTVTTLAGPNVPAMPQKRALLIGINDYLVLNDLHGCVNDVKLIQTLLTTR